MRLVVLHGRAAAGKLTVARELSGLVGYPVFHNHLVVDLLTGVFPFGSAPFVELRERWWLDVFDRAARADRSLIFTFAPEATVRPGFPGRVDETVEAAGGTVSWVRLRVSEREQERRVALPGRREFHKLADVATLRRLAAASAGPAVEEPPVNLDIDTELHPPAEATGLIVAQLGLVAQPAAERYPEG